MYKRIKYIIIVAFVGTFINANSQNSINSVYSRYGLGQLSSGNSARSKAMGGLSIGMKSDHYVNYLNPASLSAIDSLSFFFDLGFSVNMQKSETSNASRESNNTNFDYFTMGFPVQRWWSSAVGLVPFSKVGYKLVDERDGHSMINEATGGINKFFWSNSFDVMKGLSVGFNAYYLFGDTEINNMLVPSFGGQTRRDQILTKYKHISFDLGVQYSTKLNDDYNINAGFVFEPESEIDADKKMSVERGATITSVSNNEVLMEKELYDGEIIMPAKYGLGFTVESENLTAGVDIQTRMWSNTKFFNDDNQKLENSIMLAAGLEYIPNPRSFNYLRRVRYRFGTKYNKTYLNLNSKQVNDYGVSVGVGLPLRNTRTTFNITSEFGRRGTTDSNLVRENYINLSIGLTLHNIWFLKRKFD